MTAPQAIPKLDQEAGMKLAYEEVGRLHDKVLDVQQRIMEHLERVRRDPDWDYRRDERYHRLEREKAAWEKPRDALVKQLARMEAMKLPQPFVVDAGSIGKPT